MIWEYLDVFKKIRSKQKLFADDTVDKLNRSTTVILTIIVALFVGANNFGVKISCIDENIKHGRITMEYVNSLCFAKSTYTLETFNGSNRQVYALRNVYPWLPFIAVLMGLSFYLPYMLWKMFVRQNTYQHMPIDVSGIIDLLKSSVAFKRNEFNKDIILASEYLDRCFSLNNFRDGYLDNDYDDFVKETSVGSNSKLFAVNREPKRYQDRKHRLTPLHIPLIIKYLFIKLLYVLVSIGIFFFSASMLQLQNSTKFFDFGLEFLNNYFNSNLSNENENYLESKYFPIVVFCDLHLRLDYMENLNRYQYQCSLPANIFNEKAFIVLWVWFIIMVVLNTVSLFKWIIKLMFRRRIINEMLRWPLAYNYQTEKHCNSFIYDYLSTEGFLVLMFIKSNTKDWYCRAILRILWKLHVDRESQEAGFHSHHQQHHQYHKQHHNAEGAENLGLNASSAPTEKIIFRRDINLDTNEMTTPVNQIKFKKTIKTNNKEEILNANNNNHSSNMFQDKQEEYKLENLSSA